MTWKERRIVTILTTIVLVLAAALLIVLGIRFREWRAAQQADPAGPVDAVAHLFQEFLEGLLGDGALHLEPEHVVVTGVQSSVHGPSVSRMVASRMAACGRTYPLGQVTMRSGKRGRPQAGNGGWCRSPRPWSSPYRGSPG